MRAGVNSVSRPTDTPSITAKLINEQKEDKEKKNHEEKEKMKADNGFQDNYSVVVASGICPHVLPVAVLTSPHLLSSLPPVPKASSMLVLSRNTPHQPQQ